MRAEEQTPQCRVHLEKLIAIQLIKESSSLYYEISMETLLNLITWRATLGGALLGIVDGWVPEAR
jgi:hypothetical protein